MCHPPDADGSFLFPVNDSSTAARLVSQSRARGSSNRIAKASSQGDEEEDEEEEEDEAEADEEADEKAEDEVWRISR